MPEGVGDGASEKLLQVAVEHATTRVPIAAPEERVAAVREGLAGAEFESATDVAVLDGERLVGVASIESLLAADGERTVGTVMDPDPPLVGPETDQEVAAWEMCRKGEASLAVVESDGHFRGLVPPQRMLAVLLAEHDEDLARLGGYMAGTTRARTAAEEAVGRRLHHRLPWLLLGRVGAMASALLVGAVEEELDKKVLLAFFVPAVVYMADAVGGQTRVVLIRGLSVGVEIRGVAGRELLTGIVTGAIIGAVFLPFALLGWGDSDVAIAVALALFATCSIATVLAMALPWLFQRFGADPAFGAGPLATVLQDLLSIAVYLAIATPLAT